MNRVRFFSGAAFSSTFAMNSLILAASFGDDSACRTERAAMVLVNLALRPMLARK
jgi:hypothetical protein